MNKQRAKRLVLTKETLRRLTKPSLSQVFGANPSQETSCACETYTCGCVTPACGNTETPDCNLD